MRTLIYAYAVFFKFLFLGLSKYSRTSLYDHHQTILKSLLSRYLDTVVAVPQNVFVVTKIKPLKKPCAYVHCKSS